MPGRNGCATLLELVGLHKRYGDTVALNGCSFEARPGRIVGFLGPNGSGKTTTMRSIFGLVRLDAGTVLWRGKHIGHEERRRFGYMPEERGLYPRMRTLEQITYFARLHGLEAGPARGESLQWLERLGLADRSEARVEELSHGNQQRVQLAVALVGAPELLVLDEPFAGLDPIGVEALGEAIRGEARRGAAVLFSSHQLDLVEHLCDDVAIIDDGMTVLTGNLREIRQASPYRYAQMLFNAPADAARAGRSLSAIEGLRVLWEHAGEVRCQVPRDADPQAMLAAVCRLGDIGYFRFEPPALSDLFREAVES
jgi:ABC-2 type transport system ATP-binding protein